ncbi:MAG: pyrroline-5-carboxylate reductase [Maricaulis sp.]|jgi:pyrroline-5-carboxylate reductase|nr:pyrroline-5-carboxylate reductase [Maricaulis sp.]HAQ36533.1 pyrroline-5-carboxylate reductase [Alphaproteobacteria bacterium]
MSDTAKPSKTVLIGAGRMGSALAAGWLKKGGAVTPENLLIVDPGRNEHCKALVSKHGLKRVPELGPRMAKDVSLVVLGVKPQKFDEVAPVLNDILPEDTAIVSVIAGISVRRLRTAFGDRPIVRAMPNTPASIGKGITVAIANDVPAAIKRRAEKLLKVGGPVEWITDERHMGAVTALSGSGPAYVFLLAETMAAAGFAEGLPRELAERLARETIIGAAALLAESPDSPADLRRAVTSPGGTTQAALDVLMTGLPDLMRNAISAAERQSRKLGNENGR